MEGLEQPEVLLCGGVHPSAQRSFRKLGQEGMERCHHGLRQIDMGVALPRRNPQRQLSVFLAGCLIPMRRYFILRGSCYWYLILIKKLPHTGLYQSAGAAILIV